MKNVKILLVIFLSFGICIFIHTMFIENMRQHKTTSTYELIRTDALLISPFEIAIYTDSTGRSDTIISGDLRKAVIYMIGENDKLMKQVYAAHELLETFNGGSVKDDSTYFQYLSARKKWWISMQWDTTQIK